MILSLAIVMVLWIAFIGFGLRFVRFLGDTLTSAERVVFALGIGAAERVLRGGALLPLAEI